MFILNTMLKQSATKTTKRMFLGMITACMLATTTTQVIAMTPGQRRANQDQFHHTIPFVPIVEQLRRAGMTPEQRRAHQIQLAREAQRARAERHRQQQASQEPEYREPEYKEEERPITPQQQAQDEAQAHDTWHPPLMHPDEFHYTFLDEEHQEPEYKEEEPEVANKQVQAMPMRQENADIPECPICYEDLNIDPPEPIKTLHCSIGNPQAGDHLFHARCIDAWLTKSHTCPICKTPVANDEMPSGNAGEILIPQEAQAPVNDEELRQAIALSVQTHRNDERKRQQLQEQYDLRHAAVLSASEMTAQQAEHAHRRQREEQELSEATALSLSEQSHREEVERRRQREEQDVANALQLARRRHEVNLQAARMTIEARNLKNLQFVVEKFNISPKTTPEDWRSLTEYAERFLNCNDQEAVNKSLAIIEYLENRLNSSRNNKPSSSSSSSSLLRSSSFVGQASSPSSRRGQPLQSQHYHGGDDRAMQEAMALSRQTEQEERERKRQEAAELQQALDDSHSLYYAHPDDEKERHPYEDERKSRD